MKSTAIACVIAAGALGFGSLSYAQGGDWRDRDGRGGHDRYSRDSGQYQQRHHDARVQQRRHDQYNGHHQQHQQYGHYGQRGEYRQYGQHGRYDQHNQYNAYRGQYGQWTGHTPRYRRGDHLPYQFRQHQYHVNDWRAHRLYAPPHGYHWVQADGGDYLLVALATGLIANLLLNQ